MGQEATYVQNDSMYADPQAEATYGEVLSTEENNYGEVLSTEEQNYGVMGSDAGAGYLEVNSAESSSKGDVHYQDVATMEQSQEQPTLYAAPDDDKLRYGIEA